MVPNDELIDRLLSGKNRMSDAAHDDIFEQVMAEVAPAKKRSRFRFPILAGLLVASAAVLMIPIAMRSAESPQADEFGARGSGQDIATFSLNCSSPESGDAPLSCANDAKLFFDMQGTTGYPYFAAFGRHTDGTVVWYFPEALGGHSIELAEHLEQGVLDRSVVLGQAHSRGEYQVYGFYSKVPLTRADIKERFRSGVYGDDTVLINRSFSVL
ncbi:MAG: hypothetical protein JKY56_01600 [Kofleriaceae bacterium]|nr:hypothetical protein [Kofleriaceae bacterium]